MNTIADRRLPCPKCGTGTSVRHCYSLGCTWLLCAQACHTDPETGVPYATLVFAPSGAYYGRHGRKLQV